MASLLHRAFLGMSEAERKIALIEGIASGEELAGWEQGRALEGRPYLDGERAALAAKERELRAAEARGRR